MTTEAALWKSFVCITFRSRRFAANHNFFMPLVVCRACFACFPIFDENVRLFCLLPNDESESIKCCALLSSSHSVVKVGVVVPRALIIFETSLLTRALSLSPSLTLVSLRFLVVVLCCSFLPRLLTRTSHVISPPVERASLRAKQHPITSIQTTSRKENIRDAQKTQQQQQHTVCFAKLWARRAA